MIHYAPSRIFVSWGLLVIWALSVPALLHARTDAPSYPNVLFLFTDDQQHDSIHALGNNAIITPTLDRLVKQGVTFRNAYIMGGSSPAVCSPSRASLFSGRTLWNLENQGSWGYEISNQYKTLPQVFREQGYTTFATGKNEPGRRGHFARSFSTGDKLLFKGMSNQYNLPLHEFDPEGNYASTKPTIHKGKQSAEVYADAAIRFLEKQKGSDKPFFAYVAFQTPHDPRTAPQEYHDMYDAEAIELPKSFMPEHPFDNGMLTIRDEKLAGFPRKPGEVKKEIADYYAMITHTDAQIGRILECLEASGKADNTIIVFTADNGLAVGRHGLMGKQNVYDHSVHVPFILSGPGFPENEQRDQLIYIYDIYPTLCELANIPTPDTVQFKSVKDVIWNKDTAHRDHLYFAFMNWQRGLLKDGYKLNEYCVNGVRHTQLFHLANDPQEINNLAGMNEFQGKLGELREWLEKDRKELNDGNTPWEFTNKQGQEFWSTYESVETSKIP
jgi:arylsulfatase A-like enzyme